MSILHESYVPGTELEITFDSGSAVSLASVSEGGVKRLAFTFCTKLIDGSYVAFDIRQVPQFAGVFDGVSRMEKSRLEALAKSVFDHFEGIDDFHAALEKVAEKMASKPAKNLH